MRRKINKKNNSEQLQEHEDEARADEEMERKRAAEEMAKLRAPNAAEEGRHFPILVAYIDPTLRGASKLLCSTLHFVPILRNLNYH